MKITRILNLLTLLLTITVNGLANTLPINNKLTGEISDSFNALFTPAGYVFAIWGVIYLVLTVFAVYQILPGQKDNKRIDRIGPWFIIANLANAAWIFAWHYLQFALSLAIMLVLLVSLLVIYTRLEIGIKSVSPKERWLVDVPFGIYLGWISVATIANVSSVLIDLGWNGFGIFAEIWTVAMIVIAVVLGIMMTWRRQEIAYPLVLVWAIYGINQNKTGNALVHTTALIAAIVLLGVVFLMRGVIRRHNLIKRYTS